MSQPLIALLTDFGTLDPYVGVMKGVMAGRCPGAQFIDITHEVSPQQVAQGAYLLRSAYRYFPPHTVFLVVIDPGVGTARRPLAIQTPHGRYVGPDNGVFSLVLAEQDDWRAVEPFLPGPLSATFHGRDLFAPVAAELARGRALAELGPPVTELVHIPPLRVERVGAAALEGDVIHMDRFGNIVTSLGPFAWQGNRLALGDELTFEASAAQVMLGTVCLTGIQVTYGTAAPGALLALIGSDRQLEIAANRGNAAALTGARFGDVVRLQFSAQPGEER